MKNNLITYLCVFLLFPFIKISWQTSNADSLKIIALLNNAQNFSQLNADSSLHYANTAYKLSKETKSGYLRCRSTIMLAIVYQSQAEYKKSTTYFKEGIALAEQDGNKKLLAQGYNGIANMFALQKQFIQASDYFNKALAICKEIKDTSKAAVILMNLGNIE